MPMTSTDTSPVVLHADQEHTGLRSAILVILVFAIFLSFILVRLVLRAFVPDSEYIGLFSCISALPLALGAVWLAEQILKHVWHSGRKLTIDEQGIRVFAPGLEENTFQWSDSLTHLCWAFRLEGYPRGGHERRAPKKWLCLSCQLQQEENRLIVFTFLSPKRAKELLGEDEERPHFHQLNLSDVYDNTFRARIGPPVRPNIPTDILAGRDGKYWLAERRRWSEGFELVSGDFETFLDSILSRRV